MKTDHNYIIRACRLVGRACRLVGIVTDDSFPQPMAYVEEQGWTRVTSPALHALLVLELQNITGASITPTDTLHGRGWHINNLRREGGATVLTLIDIIRVLVDALEEGE